MICTKNSDIHTICVSLSTSDEKCSLHPGVRAAPSHGQVLREGEEVAIQQLRQGTISPESPLTSTLHLSQGDELVEQQLTCGEILSTGASARGRGGVHLLEALRRQRQEGGHEVPQAAAAQEHPYDHLPCRRVASSKIESIVFLISDTKCLVVHMYADLAVSCVFRSVHRHICVAVHHIFSPSPCRRHFLFYRKPNLHGHSLPCFQVISEANFTQASSEHA